MVPFDMLLSEKKKSTGKQLTKNITLSLFAQIISLLVSFMLGIIVPKFINEYQYAYWHTFLLYVSYVGVLHFGLLDGIVLRYAQYDYEDLDKDIIRSQFAALLVLCSISCFVLTIFSFGKAGLTGTITVLVACGIITKNIFAFNSFLFQLTNRINKYAFVVITQRLAYGVFVLLLIVFRQQNYIWYCIADLAGDCFGIILSIIYNKELYFGKLMPVREILSEMKQNISAGIFLLIANWTAMLLVGSAKMVIEWKWGTLVFGKTAFAFSVSNLVLAFVSAISVVLFPALKRMKQESLPSFYKELRNIVSPLLFLGLIFYYPECWLLEKWLPAYTSSLSYLGLLTPIVVYTTKVSLLTNNYLKAYRKEKVLFSLNILSVLLAFVLYGASAYLLNSINIMLLAVVFVVMFRSLLSEVFVMNIVNIDLKKEFIIEFAVTIAFLFSTQINGRWNGFLFYLVVLLIYSYVNITSMKVICGRVFNFFSR